MKLLLRLCVLILLAGSVVPCIAAPSLIDYYRAALDVDPQNQTLRYHLGIALLNQGENLQALKSFRSVYPYMSMDPEINFNLALVYTRLGDPDSALLYLDQASAYGASEQPEIYPLKNAYFNLVLLYEQQDMLEEAVRLLQRLHAEEPEHLEYLRLLGDYQFRRGHADEGIADFQKYLSLMPDDREVREYAFAAIFNLGLAAYEKRDYDSARKEFSRALQFVERSPLILYYLSLLDYQQEQYSLVAKNLSESYSGLNEELKESARSMLYNSALVLKQKGLLEGARQALTPLTVSDRPRAKDLALLAGIQLQTGAYTQARQNYFRTLQLEPGHPQVAEGILAAEKGAFGELLDRVAAGFAANDLVSVREDLETATEIYPADNRLKIYQARLARLSRESWLVLVRQSEQLEAQQQYTEALDVLRQGLKLAPAEPQLLRAEAKLVRLLAGKIEGSYQQGRDQYAQGNMHEAQTTFEHLVQLSPSHQGAKDYLQRIESRLKVESQRAIGAGDEALARADLISAQQEFNRALRAVPNEPAALEGAKRTEQMIEARVAETLTQARRFRAEGHLVTARELLVEGLKKWPTSALEAELAQVDSEFGEREKLIAYLARVAIEQQNFNQAAQLLKQATRLNRGSLELAGLEKDLRQARSRMVTFQLDLARQEVAGGNYDTGLKAYRRALDIEPGNTEALTGLKRGRAELAATIDQYLAEGAAAHQAGMLEQARLAYREVLNLDPHQAKALTALRSLDRAGKAGLAGTDSHRLYLQAIELYTEGNYRQAIVLWHQVLDLDPDNEKAKMNIDKAERKLRQIKERKSG